MSSKTKKLSPSIHYKAKTTGSKFADQCLFLGHNSLPSLRVVPFDDAVETSCFSIA